MSAQGAVAKAGKFLDSPGGLVVAVLAGGIVLWLGYEALKAFTNKAIAAAGGVVSGNNVITQNQTDFSGQPTTAYQGKGILGTVGAAANSASGGIFASLGESIGSGLYDLLHPGSSASSSSGTSSSSTYNGGAPIGSTTVTGSSASNADMGGINFGIIDGANSGW